MEQVEKISVSAETARRIRESIETGDMASADEVVSKALDAVADEAAGRADDIAWVKARLRASVEDPRKGHSSEEVRRYLDDILARAEGRQHDSAA